jgi:uncharacterized membrane protein (UPF0127 family)
MALTMKNKRTSKIVSPHVQEAKYLPQRMKGLMGHKGLPRGHALWIPKCNWIHTMFVRTPLDVVYLDDSLKVVDVQLNLRPWRLPLPRWRARSVLEFQAGSLTDQDLKIGDELLCG